MKDLTYRYIMRGLFLGSDGVVYEIDFHTSKENEVVKMKRAPEIAQLYAGLESWVERSTAMILAGHAETDREKEIDLNSF